MGEVKGFRGTALQEQLTAYIEPDYLNTKQSHWPVSLCHIVNVASRLHVKKNAVYL